MTTKQLDQMAEDRYPIPDVDWINREVYSEQDSIHQKRAAYIEGIKLREERVRELEKMLEIATGGYISACKDYWKAMGVSSESKLNEMAKDLEVFKEAVALLDKTLSNQPKPGAKEGE